MTRGGSDAHITAAHVLRHTPPGGRAQGREAALVDIAQDLLLRDLHEIGLMGELVFKGGTALRKLYAGNAVGEWLPLRVWVRSAEVSRAASSERARLRLALHMPVPVDCGRRERSLRLDRSV